MRIFFVIFIEIFFKLVGGGGRKISGEVNYAIYLFKKDKNISYIENC